MAKETNNTLADVLAFEKKLVPSDGRMYETVWKNRHENAIALNLVEKSVRGTISHRLKSTESKKLDAKIEKPNLQKVDSCGLSAECDTLKLSFTLKVLGGIDKPSACNCNNNKDFLKSYQQAVNQYVSNYQFTELAKRYALNIANGRFLWRNRVGAEKLEIVVKIKDKQFVFNGFDYSLKSFDKIDDKVNELAVYIAKALSGNSDYLLLEIDAFALVGKAQEVYPSEELVLDKSKSDKGKGNKSKILYAVKNIASMHSQKIGNAIRTIDTWYPEFDEQNLVIAIEPYGAVTNLGKAYRHPQKKVDFFTLFDKYVLGDELSEMEQHYVMAVLVRGGVFGQSAKE